MCVLVFYFQTDVKNVAEFLSVGQQVVGNGGGRQASSSSFDGWSYYNLMARNSPSCHDVILVEISTPKDRREMSPANEEIFLGK